MPTKQEIIQEIVRAAKENGDTPLGAPRFERETGISSYEWNRYWARFGDAIRESGLEPNKFQSAYDDRFLFEKLIVLIRKLQKFPTYREINVERAFDSNLPDKKVFARLGAKEELARKLSEYCATSNSYNDVIEICALVVEKANNQASEYKDSASSPAIGEVYLFKHGRYYKIGRTSDTVRRGTELRIQLPEKMHLIHSIKTDDPSGIEAYWHKRFEAFRMNGEWFDLSPASVKAFKRWKRIV